MLNYYPGDDVVDWVGVSVYGPLDTTETECASFAKGMNHALYDLNENGQPLEGDEEDNDGLGELIRRKPVFVLEFGSAARNPNCAQDRWAQKALADLLSDRWPEVRGFSWWNEAWENDDLPEHNTEMRVQFLPGLSAVFKNHLASPKVIVDPVCSGR